MPLQKHTQSLFAEEVLVELEGDEIRIPVQRQSRKTVALHVLRDGSFEVRAPNRLPLGVIRSFVHSRRDWLQERLDKLEAGEGALALQYHDGSVHHFLGEPYQLKLMAATRWFASVGDGEIRLATNKLDQESVCKALQKFYLREAEIRLPERVAFWHRRLFNRELPELKFRAMRSRWGSCASHGGITLNISLLRAPLPAIDYVVVHELCHLQHFDHSPAFHALVGSVLPDWKARAELLTVPCGF